MSIKSRGDINGLFLQPPASPGETSQGDSRMRFRYGPPPEAPDRDFENAGWKKIATPPVRRLFLWSLPITLVVFLLTYLG